MEPCPMRASCLVFINYSPGRWVRGAASGNEALDPGVGPRSHRMPPSSMQVKTGTHIGHDGIPELVNHRDKWAASGARCRPVTRRRGAQIWRGPGFHDGKVIYSDRLRFILTSGVGAMCWAPPWSVTPQPSMPAPPSIVTLGSTVCLS
jgi:hypothetical protein